MDSCAVPDPLFADPRLAGIYDELEADRSDLDHYDAILAELGATSVLDVGCGTGVLARRLAARGLTVVAVDPAAASIDVARSKPGADLVTWLHADATRLPAMSVDAAVMTGNVAQVFITDEECQSTLVGIRHAVRDGGHLVFETRYPAYRAWEEWMETPTEVTPTSAGPVEYSIEILSAEMPLLSFRQRYRFLTDGTELTSDSTLCFRDRAEIERTLVAAGFATVDVRDAPDRPGREFVFIARAV